MHTILAYSCKHIFYARSKRKKIHLTALFTQDSQTPIFYDKFFRRLNFEGLPVLCVILNICIFKGFLWHQISYQ